MFFNTISFMIAEVFLALWLVEHHFQ
jgi:hypothetical protein